MQRIEVPKESGRVVRNPGMGWYHPYYFRIDEPIDEFVMLYDLREEEGLCLLEISLEAYRDRALDETARRHFREILEFFQRNGKQVILRMCYDIEGRADKTEPTELSQVVEHIRQVADFVTGYEALIFLYQGLFIGNWGEMHSSPFATSHNIGLLYRTFRESFGSVVLLAVRKWMYLEYLEREFGKDACLTLFDDAMFADEGDLGTFLSRGGELPRLWERGTRYGLPFGGEVLYHRIPHSIREVEQYPLSYLNSRYDTTALALWRQEGLWEEISRRLGYRLVVTGVECPGWRVRIVNTGFAPVPFALRLHLWCKTEDGLQKGVADIPRGGLPTQVETTIHILMDKGVTGDFSELGMSLETLTGVPVYFANEGWEELAQISLEEWISPAPEGAAG